jgi:hypothetical protein
MHLLAAICNLRPYHRRLLREMMAFIQHLIMAGVRVLFQNDQFLFLFEYRCALGIIMRKYG